MKEVKGKISSVGEKLKSQDEIRVVHNSKIDKLRKELNEENNLYFRLKRGLKVANGKVERVRSQMMFSNIQTSFRKSAKENKERRKLKPNFRQSQGDMK